MAFLISEQSDPGIASAWLAATMGVKSNRSLKHKLKEVHIPRVCEAVTTLAAKNNQLRLASNLLYGLSLIFKHKVMVMETEVLEVNFRLQTPLFGGVSEPNQAREPGAMKIAMLTDDSQFNIDTDFIADFHDFSVRNEATLANFLVTNFGTENEPTHQEDVTSDFQNDTNVAVDFEFDLMGNIMEPDTNQPILELLNTEEDFVASKLSVDDISKSLNSMSYDQHFTTLEISRSVKTRASKKRRLSLLVDEVTTFCPEKRKKDKGSERAEIEDAKANSKISPIHVPFQEIYRQVDLRQPMFLNANRHIIFPAIPEVQQCFPRNRERRPRYFMDVEIERGRNLAAHRRSSSVFELIDHELQLEDLDFQFLADAVTMPNDMQELTTTAETSNKKLEDFSRFLHDRMQEVVGEARGYAFETLLPCTPGNDKVNRRIAANSFAYMLQLSNADELEITSREGLCTPSQVFVKFR